MHSVHAARILDRSRRPGIEAIGLRWDCYKVLASRRRSYRPHCSSANPMRLELLHHDAANGLIAEQSVAGHTNGPRLSLKFSDPHPKLIADLGRNSGPQNLTATLGFLSEIAR